MRFPNPFSPAPPPTTSRLVTPLKPLPALGHNAVKTSKYNLVDMLPRAVYEQFRRLSNFYFLIVAAVSFIPNISPSSPVTTTLPLLVVVGFGLARDVWEDLSRRRDDNLVNIRPVLVREPQTSHPRSIQKTDISTCVAVQSKDVMVGDVVRVMRDEPFPADLLLLEAAGGEICYVSTANLDGESSLKRRVIAKGLKMGWNDVEIAAPPPSDDLDAFEGVLKRKGEQDQGLGPDNLLLRGSILRNTAFVYGLVLYNGPNTKLARNMRNPPSKLGGIEKMMNRVVVGLFLILTLVTVVVSIVAGVWQGKDGQGQWYMGDFRNLSGGTVGGRSMGTFLILFHTFVPVSLFVTLEFVRIIQGAFINADLKMKSKGMNVRAKSNNLNETLGYIEHIFSDKTGTLTENVMLFVACSVQGIIFDERKAKGEVRRAVDRGEEDVINLVRAMALSHDVVPGVVSKAAEDAKESEDGSDKASSDIFQGESPDEVALVQAACDAGVELCERNVTHYTIREPKNAEPQSYQLLAKLDFSSERKRMSTILRCPDGRIRIYTKGADSVMVNLLTTTTEPSMVTMDADSFSKEGLRTLVYASRVIPEEEYSRWAPLFAEAATAMQNRSEKEAAIAAMIEDELEYLGVTAVEDKLQENVAGTIKFLREAGMRLWVLTGDKRETAENIGYSSHLLDESMAVVHIQSESPDALRDQLAKICNHIDDVLNGHSNKPEELPSKPRHRRTSTIGSDSLIASLTLRALERQEEKNLALIIDGKSLSFIQGQDFEELFLEVAGMCKTVICARVTPLQKANVVKLVRRHEHSNTLAIGDGGNDVSMIQEAHIGIGIKGKEGTQAARAADYSMPEFQHLRRLLAIHGRFSYIRTAGVINLSFYKNIFFSSTQILFQFYCFASGTTFHNQWIVTAWNSILTLFPPFLYGIFERDLEESTVLRFPSVYQSNKNNKLFSMRTVLEFTIAYSVWHATVLFFMTYVYFGTVPRIVFENGHDAGFYLTGLAVSTMAVPIALAKFLLSSHLWTGIVLMGSLFSFLILWALIPVFVHLAHERPLEGVLEKLFTSPTYHLLWPMVFVTAFIPDFLVIMLRMNRKSNVVGQLQRFESGSRRNSQKTAHENLFGMEQAST